ncbi:hypothetical protein BKA93DRAFT_751867 [Sparassis latifolia]
MTTDLANPEISKNLTRACNAAPELDKGSAFAATHQETKLQLSDHELQQILTLSYTYGEQEEDHALSKQRVLVISNTSTTSKKIKQDMNLEDLGLDNSDSGHKMPPMIWCILYETEMLCRGCYVTRVINILVINDVVFLWWYDKQDSNIQLSEVNFIQDLPFFLILLAAFQHFTLSDW